MCCLLLPAAALMGQALAPETLLLARIKTHMSGVLSRQPNYTCVESIERSRRPARSKRFQLVDALRLEVAVVEGKELFAWPGEREFKERDLREIAPGGAIANGSFALHARSVFLSGTPSFTYRGEEELEGKKTARFDYTVPQFRSGYRIRVGDAEGTAGYYGSFWADVETLDLLRLDVFAQEIPPHVPLRASSDSMHYRRVPIGESTFLLPESSELSMIDAFGNESRNKVHFSRCRQYAGESVLSFDEAPETAPEVKFVEPLRIPANLTLDVELLTPVRFPGTSTGDEVEARVKKDAKRKGVVVVPKDARLLGNVSLLEKMNGGFAVAFTWREIKDGERVAPVQLSLEEGGMIQAPRRSAMSQVYLLAGPDAPPASRNHRNVFYVRKSTLDIPRGFPMLWRTTETPAAGAQRP
jgi:hypothetical protein